VIPPGAADVSSPGPMTLLEVAKLVNDFCEGFLPMAQDRIRIQDESVAKKTW
jgi:hypothetical protein